MCVERAYLDPSQEDRAALVRADRSQPYPSRPVSVSAA